mgnify:CR=1 FL=1
MPSALMVLTIMMNLFGAATAGLFALSARGLPETAYRSWAIVCVLLLAVTLATVRVQAAVRVGPGLGSPLVRRFAIVSQALIALAWAIMVAALVLIYSA